MKKNTRPWTLYIIVLIAILAIIALVRHFHIKNFFVVEPEVLYTSGQPRGMDYTRLYYKYHIATIVNLRSAAEHREKNWYNEEITWVKNKSLNYIELPIPKRPNYFPDEQSRERFLKIMADKTNLPVLIHDSSGRKRAPMLAAVWLIKGPGQLKIDETVRVVQKIKKRPLTESEIAFIKSLRQQSTP